MTFHVFSIQTVQGLYKQAQNSWSDTQTQFPGSFWDHILSKEVDSQLVKYKAALIRRFSILLKDFDIWTGGAGVEPILPLTISFEHPTLSVPPFFVPVRVSWFVPCWVSRIRPIGNEQAGKFTVAPDGLPNCVRQKQLTAAPSAMTSISWYALSKLVEW